jgi:hypothetical protein
MAGNRQYDFLDLHSMSFESICHYNSDYHTEIIINPPVFMKPAVIPVVSIGYVDSISFIGIRSKK